MYRNDAAAGARDTAAAMSAIHETCGQSAFA